MEYWNEAQLSSIHKMLNPRSIAVVGATERMQYGGRFLNSVLQAKDKVRVYPINPRYEELMGVRCYPSLGELPESPDLVGIIVPHDRVIPALKESAEKGAGAAVIISAGFAERGEEDRRELQVELGKLAKESGVRVCGPNCLGLANVKDGIWPASGGGAGQQSDYVSGPVALVSQSGASAFGPFLQRARDKGFGYSYIVSTGNEADLEVADFIRYLLDDDDTRAISIFIEGFKDARKFLEVARLAAEKGKPIVAIKIGSSEFGTRAARSHTASLTGSDRVYEAAFKQYGVVRVYDWDELLEVTHLLAYSPPVKKPGLAVASHSGGISSLTADNCGRVGLVLPELTDHARDGINELLHGFGWASNPVDFGGGGTPPEAFPQLIDYLINEPEVGTLIVASAGNETHAQHVVNLRNTSDKVVAYLWTGLRSATSGLDILRREHIPVFFSPEKLASGLKQMQDYYAWREERLQSGFGTASPMSRGQKAVADALLASGRDALTEHEGKQLLAAWGIPVTEERCATTVEEALAAAREIGYPVVVKVDSPNILHKTEAGALRVGIGDEGALRRAYDDILRNARRYAPAATINGVLVQEMVAGGTEVIVGITQDAQVGPTLLFGTGGIFVEVFNDVVLRTCPIARGDAHAMVRQVAGSRLLQGFRGQPKGDISALEDVLMRVSDLAVNLSDRVQEIDINPLVVLPEGRGVKALDALVALKR